ncbi:MAG: uroporphyrinogen decarboxylase family protein [Oscillospiraceae bacterium]
MSSFTITSPSCSNEKSDGIMETLNTLNTTFNQVYTSAQNIADFAKAVKNKRQQEFCVLPFCHTIEAEAMGGIINFGDLSAGARVKEFAYSDLDEILNHTFFGKEDGRIYKMLEACKILKAEGQTVIFTISGFFSILCCLCDVTLFFKLLRKSPQKAQQLFDYISNQLAIYTQEICSCNADYISYADPLGTPKILGEKLVDNFNNQFTLPLLKKLTDICQNKANILVCPVTAFSLLSKEKCKMVDCCKEKLYGNVVPQCIKACKRIEYSKIININDI